MFEKENCAPLPPNIVIWLKCLIFYSFKGLKLVGLGEGTDVYIKELPVSYVKTQQIISEIWQTLHPKVKYQAMSKSLLLKKLSGDRKNKVDN